MFHVALQTVVQVPSSFDTTLYLKSGALVVGTVVIVVEGLMEAIIKPFIDAWLNPRTNPLHDPMVQLVLFVLTVGGVILAQALSPIGLGSGAAVLALFVQTAISLFSEWGFYSKLRGAIPNTPTQAYFEKLSAKLGAPPAS